MHGCAATCVRQSLALWPPRVAVVHVTREVARVNTMIVWIGDSLTRVHAQADQADFCFLEFFLFYNDSLGSSSGSL